MPRVKNGAVTKARHKKVLKEAKGYFGSKHRLYKTAKEQLMHSRVYAYRDRRQNKRNFRKLWIVRINAACRENEISYSRFINGLEKANIDINRKMLSELAIDNPKAFSEIVSISKKALEGKEVEKVEKPKAKKSKEKDINSMTVLELRELAKKKNITGYAKLKKQELIKELL